MPLRRSGPADSRRAGTQQPPPDPPADSKSKKKKKQQKGGGNQLALSPPGSAQAQPEDASPTGLRLGRVMIAASVGVLIVILVLFVQGEDFDKTMKSGIEDRFTVIAVGIALFLGIGVGLIAARAGTFRQRFENDAIKQSGPYRDIAHQLEQSKTAIERLKSEQIAELERRGVPGLEAKVATLTGELDTARKELLATQKRTTEAETARTAAEGAAETAKKAAEAAEERADRRVKQQLGQVTAKRDEASGQVETLQQANGTLTTERDAALQLNDLLGDTIARLQQDLTISGRDARRSAGQSQRRLEELGAQHQTVRGQLTAAEDRLGHADTEVKRLMADVTRLAKELAARTRDLTTARDALREDTARHLAEQAAWDHARADHETSYAALETARDRLTQRIAELQGRNGLLQILACEWGGDLSELTSMLPGRLDAARKAGHQAGFDEGKEEGIKSAPPPEELARLKAEVAVLNARLDLATRSAQLCPIVTGLAPRGMPRHVRDLLVRVDEYRRDSAGGNKVMSARVYAEHRLRLAPGKPYELAADWEARMKLTAARTALDFFTLIPTICVVIRLARAGTLQGVDTGLLQQAVTNELDWLVAFFERIGQHRGSSDYDCDQVVTEFFETGLLDNIGVANALQTVPKTVADGVAAVYYPTETANASTT